MTAVGVKPICKSQQKFESTYLYGTFSPITGEHFELELPACNTENFQLFLNEFSKENPNEFKIVLLDNGAFHKAKSLHIPENIGLLFIPPYSPELNPAEKIWWKFKRAFTGLVFKSLDELSIFIENQVKELTKDMVKSICGFDYILSASFWTTIN